MLLKGYCASLFQGCTIISSGLNLMLGLVISAVGTMVAFSAYAAAIHCNTIGYMMMFAGLFTVMAGAMAMYSACYEKIWGAKAAMGLIIIGLCLCIGSAGYATSVQSNIKTLTHDAYLSMTPEDKKDFEFQNKCCGYDVLEEGSQGCIYKTPCGKTFVNMVQKYPSMAITISAVGAGCLMFSLLMTLLMLSKMNSARKKKERHDRRHGNEERPTRVHKTTKLGSRFGTVKAAEETA